VIHPILKTQIWDELSHRDEEIVIHNPSYGAFYDTLLESILKNLERDTVIICGTLTNLCCGTLVRRSSEASRLLSEAM
jgi:nicotinamidase-related amidase